MIEQDASDGVRAGSETAAALDDMGSGIEPAISARVRRTFGLLERFAPGIGGAKADRKHHETQSDTAQSNLQTSDDIRSQVFGYHRGAQKFATGQAGKAAYLICAVVVPVEDDQISLLARRA